MKLYMKMKNYIRNSVILAALLVGAVSEAWGQLVPGDIEIEVLPPDATNAGYKVELKNGASDIVAVQDPEDTEKTIGWKVTLTVTIPANATYYIKAEDIVVEKLVDPSKANVPNRRTPAVDNHLVGRLYEITDQYEQKEILVASAGTTAKTAYYEFIVPSEYKNGVLTAPYSAYVTATFKSTTAGGVIRITSSTDLGNNPDMTATAHYILVDDIPASVVANLYSGTAFEGTFEGEAKADGTFPKITGLSQPLFNTITNGTVRNLVLEGVNISNHTGNTGAIACTANDATRIYNVGILSGSVGGTGNVGGLVGLLDGTARVINCYSFADITSGGSTGNPAKYVGGLVGNNSQTSNQSSLKTIVVNCMFYGEISTTGCSNYAPVYGNKTISNNSNSGINPYCYFLGTAAFQSGLTTIDAYKRSWPADEEYLTRFEYYRSILNSNKRLCTYWVTNKAYGSENAPTEADEALIAKWVLDPSIAPYPILKKWGKYPSIINPDKVKTIDPTSPTPTWTNRPTVSESEDNGVDAYKGGIFKFLSVTVNAGTNHAGSKPSTIMISLPITDMDRVNHDYGYYKVQLPYYNEIFGDPTVVIDPDATAEEKAAQWNSRYGGNYKANVVTGWMITSIPGGTEVTNKNGTDENGVAYDHRFTENWESGYNFADRYCTNKDLYSTSKRVFAQGGFFYVPAGVTSITIEAKWGKAVYLHNAGHYIDRVNITAQSGDRKVGDPFTPAGTLPSTFEGQTVYTEWHTAVKNLNEATNTNSNLDKTVYDNAVVLLSNFQLKNGNGKVGVDDNHNNKWYPYTIMSIDQDLDNEPDYCFELQFRSDFSRPAIQPVRFDFLPVPELGLAVRHNANPNTIGIFVPQGHFEITETSFMHTTQFEYDGASTRVNSPVILNGGHFEQIVVRYGPQNKTQYILMGGHFRMLRFTPGAHTTRKQTAKVRLCAVNAIGGEYPEFYLSGIYRPDITPESVAKQGNPHCYTNGGYFGIMAGAGYDKILGNVTFKIDHSIIDEFYGGGINGANPIGGNIDVTIDHSLVTKYCGGPKVGVMTADKTVTTHATGTTFTRFYGGGNGGTSYYREQGYDGNDYDLPTTEAGWTNIGVAQSSPANYNIFNPLNTISSLSSAYDYTKGYHGLFEFECFVESNGLGGKPTLRTYTNWAQFGTTATGNITNVLKDCIFENDFYGGGNLGNVSGYVKSTLTNCTVKGNVFGGGFSGKIEPFRIHDKNTTVIPWTDKAGVMHNGYLNYKKDGTQDRYYTWCYKDPTTGEIFPEGLTFPSTAPTTDNPTFQDSDGKWYVLTTVSLEGLGAVSNYTSLTLDGTTVGTAEGTGVKAGTGNVYGGGNESAVNGNTTVTLQGNTTVLGDVFGGGNKAEVKGGTTVNIE